MRRYFVLSGALTLGYGTIFTLLGALRDTYGFTETQLGMITAVGFLSGVVAQLGLARFADRGHTAAMVRSGLALAAMAMVVCALTDEFGVFVVGRALLGLGSGMASPAMRRLVFVRSPDDVGTNLGRQTSWDIGGFILGPLLAGTLAQLGGIPLPFAVFSVLYVALLAWSFTLDLTADVEDDGDAVDKRLLRNRAVGATVLATIAFYATVGVFDTSWAVLLKDHGVSNVVIGITLSLFAVPVIFLAPIGGRTAQRRGPLRTVAVSLAIAAVCTFSYGVLDIVWALIAISVVHAVADSFTMPANRVAVAVAASRSRAAAAQGLLGAAGLATAAAAGLTAGVVYQHAGAFVLFAGTAVFMTVCLVGALALGRDILRRPTPTAVEHSEVPVPLQRS